MTSALDLLMDSDSTAETTTLLESNGICTIDSRTRTIFVPPEIVVGAVQSDKNAERIKFSCPKIVGDNLDLSKFSIRINFENVSSVDPDISIKDQYICEDASVNEDNITFSWVIGKNAARYMGTIRFIVCAVKTDSDSNISIEWNTTVAQIPVLEGIEIDQPSLDESNKDVINQLLAITKTASDEAVKNVNSAKEQAITDIQNVLQPDKTLTVEGGIADAKATGNAISSLRGDIEEINIIPIKNCVEKIDAGHYWDNAGYLVENINYDAVTIKVNAGKKYSVNKLIGDNNFNLVIGKDGNIIEKFTSDMCKPIGNGYYFTAPNNAEYLKLSSGLTTYFNTLIIVEGVKDISNYDISKYPIGIPVKIKSNLPFQTMNGLDVDEVGKYLSLFNDCQSVNLIDTFTNVINQYFDGNNFAIKDGYRYYKRNVNANETYKVTALTDGEVPFTFYLLDFNGDVLRKETDCKDTIIFIEQDGIMIINSSWKHSLDPVVNLMTYDGSKQIIAPRIFYCGKNRQFKKLKDCIEEATKYMDAVVYVDDGIYDLISEFGVDYLDSYNGTDNIGIELKNRVHIIFSSGATVVFNYTGTNEATQKYFSPFNAGAYGYTLENAWVESVNCKYSVHDERANADDSYHNVYKRCVFIHDSSKASGWHASQAIGGGLGKYGDILIEDCYCKSVGNDDSISYHSPNVSEEGNNSKSKIVVKNTYTSGTLCFIPLGNSSRKTPIYVTGCNTRIAPYLNGSAETMELTQWGNTIREN